MLVLGWFCWDMPTLLYRVGVGIPFGSSYGCSSFGASLLWCEVASSSWVISDWISQSRVGYVFFCFSWMGWSGWRVRLNLFHNSCTSLLFFDMEVVLLERLSSSFCRFSQSARKYKYIFLLFWSFFSLMSAWLGDVIIDRRLISHETILM